MSVPPGSLASVTGMPASRSASASMASCVLLPQPSGPSKTRNFPASLLRGEVAISGTPPRGDGVEDFAGVVGAADERSGGDGAEAECPGLAANVVELVGWNVPGD